MVKRFDVLKSIERNPATTDAPYRSPNVTMERMGGYTPLGKVESSIIEGITTERIARLVGYDRSGVVSYINPNSQISVLNFGTNITGIPATVNESAQGYYAPDIVHIPKVGFWTNPRHFNILYRTGTNSVVAGLTSAVSSFAISVQVSQDLTNGNLPERTYYLMALVYFNTDAGRVLAKVMGPTRVDVPYDKGKITINTTVGLGVSAYADVYLFSPDYPPLDSWPAVLAGTLSTADTSLIIAGEPTQGSVGANGRFFSGGFKSSVQPELHQGRLWSVLETTDHKTLRRGIKSMKNLGVFGKILGYSEVGWVNLSGPENFITIEPSVSKSISALLSFSGGLLVFFDNETWIVQGTQPPFQVRPYPAVVGCDTGTMPASIGGDVIYTIWRGRIYAIAGGRAEQVSLPAWMARDSFSTIIPEARKNHLLAKMDSGRILRYDPENNMWWENPVELGNTPFIFPTPRPEGTYYMNRASATLTSIAKPANYPDEDEFQIPDITKGEEVPNPIMSYPDKIVDYQPQKLLGEGVVLNGQVESWEPVAAVANRLTLTRRNNSIVNEESRYPIMGVLNGEEAVYGTGVLSTWFNGTTTNKSLTYATLSYRGSKLEAVFHGRATLSIFGVANLNYIPSPPDVTPGTSTQFLRMFQLNNYDDNTNSLVGGTYISLFRGQSNASYPVPNLNGTRLTIIRGTTPTITSVSIGTASGLNLSKPTAFILNLDFGAGTYAYYTNHNRTGLSGTINGTGNIVANLPDSVWSAASPVSDSLYPDGVDFEPSEIHTGRLIIGTSIVGPTDREILFDYAQQKWQLV